MSARTYTLPRKFWDDHEDRDLRCHERCDQRDLHESMPIRKTKTTVTVTLTTLDLRELISDADYYADWGWISGSDNEWKSAAKRMLRAIHRNWDRDGGVPADLDLRYFRMVTRWTNPHRNLRGKR